MRQILMLAAAVAIGWPAVGAEEDVTRAVERDIVLRALVDELGRSFEGLRLPDLDAPYFIEFGLTDLRYASVTATLGAVTTRGDDRRRGLYTDVRVGSYELDNTNFSGGGYGSSGQGGVDVPLEDDYLALRQAIWWAADRDYKGVVETLAKKKAFMEGKIITDKPPDFSREPVTVYLAERRELVLDPAPLEALAVDLSGVFRAFPEVQDSSVTVSGILANKYMVNTEGTRLRTGTAVWTVSVSATVQADDGMKLSDSLTAYARRPEELPGRDELVQRCRDLARQLVALKNAPVLDSYTGPVLFDPPAATVVFQRQFGTAFAGGQRPVGSRTSPDDLANKLNKRILPRFLHVVDDPSLTTLAGEPVLGHYTIDDQGVAAQTVQLVQEGRLLTQLMSRNPSKDIPRSTGHGRSSWGLAQATFGCLVVTAEPAYDDTGLKQELLDYMADEGLEFGLRIASLGSVGEGGRGGTHPLEMYKVYPDGREELVRGAEIARIDFKSFRRVLAAGDTPYVRNVSYGLLGQTLAVPALLFEELDLAKIDRDFDKPPILPTPLARDAD